MKINLLSYNLKLKHTFTISRESHDIQPTVIVCLEHNGKIGYGEATSNPYYNMTTDVIKNAIEKHRDKIEAINVDITSPEDFWDLLSNDFSDNNFALCALDIAYNDLYAKLQDKKLYEVWNYSINTIPLTNYTIAIDSIEKMIEKIKEKPWPLYKVKLGTKNDIAIIENLRKHTDATFRVDANCGWSAQETIEYAPILKKLGVEFIEQPIKADDWDSIQQVYNESVLPIIADESCIIESDVKKCHGFYHGVNIKLVKCGGLTPARRMIKEAKKLGLKTMVGCMTESTIGISAIAHLLPELDYVDMDGALLLKEDIATGVTITDGKVSYANTNGTGASLL